MYLFIKNIFKSFIQCLKNIENSEKYFNKYSYKNIYTILLEILSYTR